MSEWAEILRDATTQTECWCGQMSGHAGWLLCAEDQVGRRVLMRKQSWPSDVPEQP